jgi:hypothetical protein
MDHGRKAELNNIEGAEPESVGVAKSGELTRKYWRLFSTLVPYWMAQLLDGY